MADSILIVCALGGFALILMLRGNDDDDGCSEHCVFVFVCVCVVCVLCVCVCVSVCCERYVVLCDKLEVSQSCHLVQSSVHWHLAGDSNGSHRNETIFQMQIKLFKYDIWSDENRGQQLIDFWTYSHFHFLI